MSVNTANAETGKADDFNNRVQGETILEELQRLHGEGSATFVKADVTKPEDVENAVAKCVEAFGRLDIMANNAGEYPFV